MIVYISYPKNSAKELLQLINTFNNAGGYKINSKKPVALLYTDNNGLKEKSEQHHPSQ